MNAQRTFVPRLESLEDRCLPSSVVQTGSMLNVSLTNLANAALIVENGVGNVAVVSNGTPLQFFSGVNNIQVAANGLANAVFFLNLAPLQAQAQLSIDLKGIANIFFEHVTPGGAPLMLQQNPPVFTIPF